MNRNYKKNNKFGFTLLEMSITILILSILMIGGINFQIKITNNSRENITIYRLERLEKALNEYIVEYGRLPCPASLTATENNSNYGKELRNSGGSCYGESSSFVEGNLIYGAIPNKTLNLTDDYGVDAWKNRIVYVIDKNYGEKQSFLNSAGEAIEIQNANSDVLTDRAIYVLFSGGENENGVFRNGIQKPIDSNFDDKSNVFKNNFDKIFIKDVKSDNYDDLLYYRTKKDFVYELGLQDMPCNLKELALLDGDWEYSYNTSCKSGICQRGTMIPSKNVCPGVSNYSKNPHKNTEDSSYRPLRKCLKYGQWSDIIYPCGEGCGESNIATIVGGGFASTNQLRDAIGVNYLKRVKKGEEITLECINNDMVGYITLLCREDGTWEYRNGGCINSNKLIPY